MTGEVPSFSDVSVMSSFQRRTEAQQTVIRELMRGYQEEGKVIQANKLIEHALLYVDEGRVHLQEINGEVATYEISGKHDPHKTSYNTTESSFVCDCKLFLGQGEYEGQAGECSHIQAVKIVRVDEIEHNHENK